MDVLTQLINARALIAKPESWGTNYLRRDDTFCARGAIQMALNGNTDSYCFDDRFACVELVQAIPEAALLKIKDELKGLDRSISSVTMIARYNNTGTHEAVLAMFDATIARLKREKVVSDLLTQSLNNPAESSNLSVEAVD